VSPVAAPRRARLPLRGARDALTPGPRLRRRAAALVAACVALAALYLFVLRDLPLFAVDRVLVGGVSGPESARVRQTLEATAEDMTTLHYDAGELRRAVDEFPTVAGIAVAADFPDTLRITVRQRQPAAIVVSGRARVIAAGDGTVLRAARSRRGLPLVHARESATAGAFASRAVLPPLRVAGDAPAALVGRLERIRVERARGIVVDVRDGPVLIFGSDRRAEAKWVAATRVLADPSAAGASYIDVRLPERPAAGGVAAETVAPIAPAPVTPVNPQP
jgi:cell division protein FtsQ